MSIFASLLQTLRIRRAVSERDDLTDTGLLADVDFLVPNMVCEGCAEKITTALQAMSGVRETRSKVPQKRIQVRYEPAKVHEQQLKDAVSKAGFTALDA